MRPTKPRSNAIARVRAQLDEDTFASAWTEGRALNANKAVAYALYNTQNPGAPSRPNQASKRWRRAPGTPR